MFRMHNTFDPNKLFDYLQQKSDCQVLEINLWSGFDETSVSFVSYFVNNLHWAGPGTSRGI